jgi:hypothetical protein
LSAGAICAVWPIIAQPVRRKGRFHFVQRQIHAEPGNRLELVERPAGMTQAAARHHRHRHTARRRERRQNQRRLVADAARAVLVDLDARDVGEIHADTRVDHRVGEPGSLLAAHAAKENRHQQRGRLILRKCPGGDAINEELDLLAGQRAAIPFLHDHVNCAHAVREYIGSASPLLRCQGCPCSYGAGC